MGFQTHLKRFQWTVRDISEAVPRASTKKIRGVPVKREVESAA